MAKDQVASVEKARADELAREAEQRRAADVAKATEEAAQGAVAKAKSEGSAGTVEVPQIRRFLMKANARCGRDGAFNGQCVVKDGDTFFMDISPVRKRQPDGSIKLVERRMPTWADVIDEYELPKAPQPLRKVSKS